MLELQGIEEKNVLGKSLFWNHFFVNQSVMGVNSRVLTRELEMLLSANIEQHWFWEPLASQRQANQTSYLRQEAQENPHTKPSQKLVTINDKS